MKSHLAGNQYRNDYEIISDDIDIFESVKVNLTKTDGGSVWKGFILNNNHPEITIHECIILHL